MGKKSFGSPAAAKPALRRHGIRRKWWPLFFLLCLAPFLAMVYRTLTDSLGPNPEEELLHVSGEFFLRLLLVTLLATPAQRIFGFGGLLRYRRMLGLYAFFYGCVHLLVYLWFTQFFDWLAIWEDLKERNYILLGMLGWLLLLPLAITSSTVMVQRLGKRWISLHRLVYLGTLAGLLHYWMSVKADIRGPAVHAGIFAILLLVRVLPLGRKPGK